jgi:hypothetical protein
MDKYWFLFTSVKYIEYKVDESRDQEILCKEGAWQL